MENAKIHAKDNIINGMSVDVEDYFQVSNFEDKIDRSKWSSCELRVEQNTLRVLDLFDRHNVKATFFILGWVAQKAPDLVREIARRGHEVASHGYHHQLVYNMTDNEFAGDITRTKEILESLAGKEVIGYRAPSYSITAKNFSALKILYRCGYRYDSSIFPIHHHRYGIPDFSRFAVDIPVDGGESIREYPISTVRLFGKNLPVGGGAYARLFPLALITRGLAGINRKEGRPFIFYFHPWEIDPHQPKIACSRLTRIRHYGNLRAMERKLETILQKFNFQPIKDI
ncbi:MAG: DUF3473 domain-containing protein [Candidatus Auribacterota bacterium]|jgi:polysaccharide deacetylase family protein (PEP-CTERM system associated)|nr:DUF3473 domain-containing protein [Candidatus Auribacterota bacterium]